MPSTLSFSFQGIHKVQCNPGAELESLNAKSAVDKHTEDVFQKCSVCCVPLSKFDSLALVRSTPKIFSRGKEKKKGI
jgi:hypothetical protein